MLCAEPREHKHFRPGTRLGRIGDSGDRELIYGQMFMCLFWPLSTELEFGNAPERFLQTPTPTLNEISGPMGAQFLSSVGLGFGTLIGQAHLLPIPSLDKNQFPN